MKAATSVFWDLSQAFLDYKTGKSLKSVIGILINVPHFCAFGFVICCKESSHLPLAINIVWNEKKTLWD